jgi:hypothetical protein
MRCLRPRYSVFKIAPNQRNDGVSVANEFYGHASTVRRMQKSVQNGYGAAMLMNAPPEPKSWTETFKGALIESCAVVLFTATFLWHARWWVMLCWTLCTVTVAIALSFAYRRNQPEDYAVVRRLVTMVQIVMTFLFLITQV